MRLLLLMLLISPAVAEERPAGQTSPLKVMSFNIRYGSANDGPNHWKQRQDLVVQVLRDHQPDIVGLQEALRFQMDVLREALPGYREIGVGREDGKTQGEYSAILYCPDRFEGVTSGTFWLSDTPDVPGSITWGNACTRVCSWVHLRDRQTRRMIAVYNTHWDHKSQPSRLKSAALITKRMQQSAEAHGIILMGDLNADEQNPAARLLQEVSVAIRLPEKTKPRSAKLVDTFRVLHPQTEAVGTFNGFKGGRGGGKIDYVFATANFKVVEACILYDQTAGRYPSDHFPVTATLDF